ncbi:hypothetical protein EKO04_003669 [Ascochyta lentis]|uniref:Uncharacterized protein n=1 Tax=Ascochyta lentis TaxID=205686 RepID=A0A8H7MFE9_9PLEO|nr:hypothetical protein EKO04_003669 [Ascochyta lentis]
MSNLTASVGLRRDYHASHPQMFRRTFRCGHPDEFIEIRRNDGQRVHNLVTLALFQRQNQACSNGLEFTVARCLDCARKVKEEDDKDASVLLKRSIGAYRAGASSKLVSKSGTPYRNGFDDVLERYRLRDGKSVSKMPHRRVSEQEHQTFRLEAQAQAQSTGKLVAIPSKRICNVPILRADEDKSSIQPRIDTVIGEICYAEGDSGLSDTLSKDQNDKTLPSVSVQQDQYEDEHMKKIIIKRAGIAHFTPASSSASNHDKYPMTVIKANSSKPEPNVGPKISIMKGLAAKNEESLISNNTTSAPLQDAHVPRPKIVDILPSPGRESVLVEHLIDQPEAQTSTLCYYYTKEKATRLHTATEQYVNKDIEQNRLDIKKLP